MLITYCNCNYLGWDFVFVKISNFTKQLTTTNRNTYLFIYFTKHRSFSTLPCMYNALLCGSAAAKISQTHSLSHEEIEVLTWVYCHLIVYTGITLCTRTRYCKTTMNDVLNKRIYQLICYSSVDDMNKTLMIPVHIHKAKT